MKHSFFLGYTPRWSGGIHLDGLGVYTYMNLKVLDQFIRSKIEDENCYHWSTEKLFTKR